MFKAITPALIVFPLLFASSGAHARWCGNLPRESAAFFACESLNLQERAEAERRRNESEAREAEEARKKRESYDDFKRRARAYLSLSPEEREKLESDYKEHKEQMEQGRTDGNVPAEVIESYHHPQ